MAKNVTPVYEYIEEMLEMVLDGNGIVVTDLDLVREALVREMGEFNSLKYALNNLEESK